MGSRHRGISDGHDHEVTDRPKEEDIVIPPAEERLAAEQQMIISKVERLTRWAKYFGFTSLALLVMVGGIWLYRAMLVFNGQVSQ